MKHKSKLRKAQSPIYTFDIETFSHEGRGIAHFGAADHPSDKAGKKVFIRYALPDEKVKAKITNQTARYEEAEMVELLSQPSPLRVEAPCPHYGVCGGCSMQHIQVNEQILLKQNVLRSHLKHFAGIDVEEWLSPIPSLRTDYRHRARLGVRYISKNDRLILGFRAPQSNQLTPILTCTVLDQALSKTLPEIQDLLENLQAKANIGHIELAKGDQEVCLLIRHLAPFSASDVNQLQLFALKKNWQLYFQPQGVHSVHRVDRPDLPMRLHYTLPKFDLSFAFAPTDFTQVNPDVNAKMIELACELLQLKAGERVLDLFCGLGNFSLPLALCVGADGKVVAVEASEDMVRRGTENAKRNHLMNVVFYSQDLTKDFSHQPWAKQGFDALLIDPPRAGAYEVMSFVPDFGVKRIVYISCNPSTLARDAGVLVQHGYRLKKATVMDMFTHTEHVESIALFEKEDELND